jgi:transcription elongation factor GreB
MSKAFTREDDDAPEPSPRPRRVSSLPSGTKNYITAEGAARMRDELTRLVEVERPSITAAAGDPAGIERRSDVDARIVAIQQVLGSAVVVEPLAPPWDEVRFGAWVSTRDRGGGTTTYRIVGVDETDLGNDHVSWISPVAKALLNGRLGQRVRLRLPGGDEDLEITDIRYR